MADYRLKEFAELCGISPAALSVAKSRKKVNVSGGENLQDQRVDSEDPLNKAFMQRCQARKSNADVPAKPAGAAKKAKEKDETPVEPEKPGPLLQIEIEKKSVDLEKAQQDRDLNRIKLEKMRGELVPTKLVRSAFSHILTSFSVSFKQSVDSLLIEITQTAHLNRNQQAELRGKLTRILNAGIDKGVADAKTTVDNIVSEYRED